MQQWSPSEFSNTGDGGIPTHHGVEVLENPDFVEDRPEDGAATFMKRLEPDERDALYAMVETDIRAEVQSELFSQYGEHLELLRMMLSNLKHGLEKAVADELHRMSLGAVELALAVGERLARTSIEADRTYLMRVLHDLVGRTHVGAELTLIAHPEEIEKLKDCDAGLKDLNVVALVPDLALEPGGCIVQTAGQEWDLTFRGQADALGEHVREAMLYGRDTEDADVANLEEVPVDPEEGA